MTAVSNARPSNSGSSTPEAAPVSLIPVPPTVKRMIDLDRWFRKFPARFQARDVKPSSLNKAGVQEWSKIMKIRVPNSGNTYTLIKGIFELSPVKRQELATKLSSKVAIDKKLLVTEIDSIISRATSFHGMDEDPAILERMIQELKDITISGRWSVPAKPTPLPEDLNLGVSRSCNGQLVVRVYDRSASESGTLPTPLYSLSNQTLMSAFHRAYPRMPMTSAGVLTIMYHFQRAYDGSNWSPDDSYRGLQDDYDSGKVGILECFSGCLNNQDTIRGRPMTHGRLSLEWETLRDLTGDSKFVGSWPEGVYPQLTRLFDQFQYVRLLVNPPYSEPEIARTAQELARIFSMYPRSSGKTLRVSMTLPAWPDIYEKGGPFHEIEGATITRTSGGKTVNGRVVPTVVHNRSFNPEGFAVPLRYELLELRQV